ncbi:MAG: MarR family transcriptional regulator [Firmicutes bacterium]|nr:MarR family transcriptional regulator [Bacillota bacterium]
MIEKDLTRLLELVQLDFLHKVFSQVREREGSLSAMEVFSLVVIQSLDCPTIGQFARFIGVSQSNATYKVNSLIDKGYLLRLPSEDDRRECRIAPSGKYIGYISHLEKGFIDVGSRINEALSPEAAAELQEILTKLADAYQTRLRKD